MAVYSELSHWTFYVNVYQRDSQANAPLMNRLIFCMTPLEVTVFFTPMRRGEHRMVVLGTRGNHAHTLRDPLVLSESMWDTSHSIAITISNFPHVQLLHSVNLDYHDLLSVWRHDFPQNHQETPPIPRLAATPLRVGGFGVEFQKAPMHFTVIPAEMVPSDRHWLLPAIGAVRSGGCCSVPRELGSTSVVGCSLINQLIDIDHIFRYWSIICWLIDSVNWLLWINLVNWHNKLMSIYVNWWKKIPQTAGTHWESTLFQCLIMTILENSPLINTPWNNVLEDFHPCSMALCIYCR